MRRYRVIYADPPWRYSDQCMHRGGAARHYPTVSRPDLALLPVDRLALPDAALFLWVTPPNLIEGIALLRAWGFTFKTIAFTWIKTTSTGKVAWGMGHWTRANAEHVLLGIRGRPKRVSAAVHQVVHAPRGDHSAKPPEVRERIEKLLGDVRRVELFARERVDGWDAWGLDVEPTPNVVECLGRAA